VILDPAPAQVDVVPLLPLADVVTPNETELRTLTPGFARSADGSDAARARRLLEQGAGRVIAKLGERGALEVSADGERAIPPMPVSPVDTTAAGDVFNGAYAVALAEGRGRDEAAAFATAAAALSVTRRGAQPSMPSRDEVSSFRERSR
jgi:ribokinase